MSQSAMHIQPTNQSYANQNQTIVSNVATVPYSIQSNTCMPQVTSQMNSVNTSNVNMQQQQQQNYVNASSMPPNQQQQQQQIRPTAIVQQQAQQTQPVLVKQVQVTQQPTNVVVNNNANRPNVISSDAGNDDEWMIDKGKQNQ